MAQEGGKPSGSIENPGNRRIRVGASKPAGRGPGRCLRPVSWSRGTRKPMTRGCSGGLRHQFSHDNGPDADRSRNALADSCSDFRSSKTHADQRAI